MYLFFKFKVPQQPTGGEAQEGRTCPVCLFRPINAVWTTPVAPGEEPCGHLLCKQCAITIKNGRGTCHICRAPATSFLELRGTY